jgi:hypothetical protein
LPASAALAATAQCLPADSAARLLVGQEIDAKDGVAASSMPAPTVIERQDLSDIRNLQYFFSRNGYHAVMKIKRKCLAAQQHAQNIINFSSA